MNWRLSKHPWSAHATASAGASVPSRCGMCASYAGEPIQCAEEIPVTPASAGTEVVGVESVYLCLNPLPCSDHPVGPTT